MLKTFLRPFRYTYCLNVKVYYNKINEKIKNKIKKIKVYVLAIGKNETPVNFIRHCVTILKNVFRLKSLKKITSETQPQLKIRRGLLQIKNVPRILDVYQELKYMLLANHI